MSIFSIKVKTKSGNDIKKKETFTVWFRLAYRLNALTRKRTVEYTFRVAYSGGAIDPKAVLELKAGTNVNSIEDLTLKVLLNLCHLLASLSKTKDINPDFILFMSPDLEGKKNKAWMFLKDVFGRDKVKDDGGFLDELMDMYDHWDVNQCNRLGIRKEELDMLKDFVDRNPNTVFMNIDPNKDPKKYAKSIAICSDLQDRMDRKFQQDIDY